MKNIVIKNKSINIINSLYLIFLSLFFVILFLSPETSIQTHFAFTRNTLHSIYLSKILSLQSSDYFILLTLITFIVLSICRKYMYIDKTIFLYLLILCVPFIGFYSGIIEDKITLKFFLYDIKLILYMLTGYLLTIELIRLTSITTYNLILITFILWFLGSFLDSYIVYNHYQSEYPSKLGIPALSDIVPPIFLLSVLIRGKINLIFLCFVFISYISLYISMVTLSGMYWLFVTLVIIIIYEIINKLKGFLPYLIFLLSIIVLYFFGYNLILFLGSELSNIKSSGFTVRKLELVNFFLNNNAFTIIFGNGWGAGWEEINYIESGNKYSRGVNSHNLNFVWHHVIGANFYRQGILFFTIMSLYIFYLAKTVKSQNIKNIKRKNPFFSVRIDWLLISMTPLIISPGILKYTLFIGVVLALRNYENKE